MDGDTLVIENATSVMLLTRIEYFPEYSEEQSGSAALRSGTTDTRIMTRFWSGHARFRPEMLNRVTVDFGGAQNMRYPPRSY